MNTSNSLRPASRDGNQPTATNPMNTSTETKPEGLQDKHLVYLDDLRESGATNMFGARPYLMRKFGLEGKQAAAILVYWMHTFEQRHP